MSLIAERLSRIKPSPTIAVSTKARELNERLCRGPIRVQ